MGLVKIISAVILALPAFLVAVVTAPLIALLSLPSLALLCFKKESTHDSAPQQQHAIISGGSSGIGLSIAQDCVKRGMSKVTLLARNKTKLEAAVKHLEEVNTGGTTISFRSTDVSDASSIATVAQEITSDSDDQVLLVCCAGLSYPGYWEHLSASTYAQLTQVNQLGTIYTVQAFLKHMSRGTIVLTSSMAGQVGVYGLSAYSPTKFALRGFAECLHQELISSQINIQVAFPPDTDTPMFEEENKTKPLETRLICEVAGLAQPQQIAQQMVEAALKPNPDFLVYFSVDGWMLSALTAGMGPVTSLADAVTQVALGGIFRFVALFYLNDWWRVIRNCAKERKRADKPRPTSSKSEEKKE